MIRNPIRAVPGGDVTALRPAQGGVCSGSPEGRWTSPAGWAYDPAFPEPLQPEWGRPWTAARRVDGRHARGSPACWLAGSHARTERDLLPEGYRTSAARCGCGGAGTARRPVRHAAMLHGDHEGQTRPLAGRGRG